MLSSTLFLLAQAPVQTPPQSEFTSESCNFGLVVAPAGDQDRDGVPDYLIGEDSDHRFDGWILSGKDGRRLGRIHTRWLANGTSQVLLVHDMDHDELPDFVICHRSFDPLEPSELVLQSSQFHGEPWRIPVHRPAQGDSFRLVPDADGDGFEDIGLIKHAGGLVELELTTVSTKTGAIVLTQEFEAAREWGACGFLDVPNVDGGHGLALLEAGRGSDHAALELWGRTRAKLVWRMSPPLLPSCESASLALLDDLDGDGRRDLAISLRDRVRVLSGASGGTLYEVRRPSPDDIDSRFGWRVVGIGDADGDGIGDFVLTEPDALSAEVLAVSGKSGARLWSTATPAAAGVLRFGESLAVVGDVDGDKVADVLAGSLDCPADPGYAALLSGRTGAILREFRRDTNGEVALRDPVGVSAAASRDLVREPAPFRVPDPPESALYECTSLFGSIVCAAGDQDGDSVPDLLVGEPGSSRLDCWLLSGKDGGTLRTFHRVPRHDGRWEVLPAPDIDHDGRTDFAILALDYDDDRRADMSVVSGATGADLWRSKVPRPDVGQACRLVRDFDGDGLGDFGILQRVAGEPRVEWSVVSSKTGARIRTLVFSGPAAWGTSGFLERLGPDREWQLVLLEQSARGSALIRAFVEATGREIWSSNGGAGSDAIVGSSIALTGDVDGDGVLDLAVTLADKVGVLSGKDGTFIREIRPKRHDPADDTGFGDHLLPLGDADGDGCADIAFTEEGEVYSGNLYAYSGKTGKELWAIAAPFEAYVLNLGCGFASVGDIDGDGVTDLIAGTLNATIQAPGWAFLMSGKTGKALLEFRRSKDKVIASRPDPAMKWSPNR